MTENNIPSYVLDIAYLAYKIASLTLKEKIEIETSHKTLIVGNIYENPELLETKNDQKN